MQMTEKVKILTNGRTMCFFFYPHAIEGHFLTQITLIQSLNVCTADRSALRDIQNV